MVVFTFMNIMIIMIITLMMMVMMFYLTFNHKDDRVMSEASSGSVEDEEVGMVWVADAWVVMMVMMMMMTKSPR